MFDRIDAIGSESARIAELIDGADLGARVPCCPDWSFRDLVWHIGRVQRFWTGDVRAQNAAEPWAGTLTDPSSDADLARWMWTSTEGLQAALSEVDDAAPCWTWWGDPATCGAVARHQVQEVAVHRWDAESALGSPAPLDASMAHDGVGELLEVMIASGSWAPSDPITFLSSDTNGYWSVGGSGKGPSVGGSGNRASARATLRGTASDLVLFLHGRTPEQPIDVKGDSAFVQDLRGAGIG